MSERVSIPDRFARMIRDTFPEQAETWLRGLPALVDELAARWSLRVGPPFDLSYNYVAPATRSDGTRVVLKVGVPHKELFSEMSALRRYDGRGAVRLLDVERERGAMLLERVEPGDSLRPLANGPRDEEATRIIARVMRDLWRPAPADSGLPSVEDWARGLERMRARFDGGPGPFPAALVEKAGSLFTDLLASSAEPVLLHGDLHHDNVLRSGRDSWVAIDPKGIVGEPAYEVGALLRNWLPDLLHVPDPRRVQERRIAVLAEELGFERARIRGWGLAQAVLSAWWTIEDNGQGWEPAIACAELLAAIRV